MNHSGKGFQTVQQNKHVKHTLAMHILKVLKDYMEKIKQEATYVMSDCPEHMLNIRGISFWVTLY
jgi:hypothetical protein